MRHLSIVPTVEDTVYLVVDELFQHGRVWREAEFGKTDLDTVIQDIIDAQYNDPFRVVAFNADDRWAKDVSADIAAEVRRHFERQGEDVPPYLARFVDRYDVFTRQLALKLA